MALTLEELGLLPSIPARVRQHGEAAMTEASAHQRAVRWEVNRIVRALAPTGVSLILLKGAAYVMAGLRAARGRLFSDVDILVPRQSLPVVEQALLAAGWEAVKLDAYDQRYYRTWMHELPPMRHRERHTTVDVHHAILPLTGRLHPDSGRLIAAARTVPGSDLCVLAPPDMVLHAAAHLFQDGDLRGGLRDITDLDALLTEFGRVPGFWEGLVARGREMDLARPLFYALRLTRDLLGTAVPDPVRLASQADGPPAPIRAVMDTLVRRAVMPPPPEGHTRTSEAARWLLYVRSQWLRMPPRLLARHLLTKSGLRSDE
jgi:hypothetical protein